MSARLFRVLTVLLVALGMLAGGGAALADENYPPPIPPPPVDPETPEVPEEPEVPEVPEVPEAPEVPEEPEVGGEFVEGPEATPDDDGLDATPVADEGVPGTPDADVVADEVVVLGVSLPRTGTSVTLLALLGAGLIGLGILLVARRRSPGEPA